MKIKVSETTPLQLDWLVATLEGYTEWQADTEQFIAPRRKFGWVQLCDLNYSTNPAQGQPILERERIDTAWSEDGWYANMYWRGQDVVPGAGETFRCGGDGPTMLIAGLRCYVASKLGDEVEVPEELL